MGPSGAEGFGLGSRGVGCEAKSGAQRRVGLKKESCRCGASCGVPGLVRNRAGKSATDSIASSFVFRGDLDAKGAGCGDPRGSIRGKSVDQVNATGSRPPVVILSRKPLLNHLVAG